MGRPYSVINRATELKDQLDAYRLWQDKTRAQKQAAYVAQKALTLNPRTARTFEQGYLQPFGVNISKKLFVECRIPVAGTAESGITEAETALITTIREKVVTTGEYAALAGNIGSTAGNTVYGGQRGIQGKLAKVTVVDVGDKKPGIKSRKTNAPYSYRKRNAVSCPFGQKSGVESYESAKLALSATAVFGLSNSRRVYFKPQGDLGIAIITA